MKNQEYEHKKRECWIDLALDAADMNKVTIEEYKRIFNSVFDRAYALGEQGTKQEKDADTNSVDLEELGKMLDEALSNETAVAFNQWLSQKADAEGDDMLTCNKDSVCKFYSHLLDMVENERMSEHYPEWCDLESEYIALYGEKAFADYFRADTKQAPAKTKFEVGDIVRIKSDAAEYHQGYVNYP